MEGGEEMLRGVTFPVGYMICFVTCNIWLFYVVNEDYGSLGSNMENSLPDCFCEPFLGEIKVVGFGVNGCLEFDSWGNNGIARCLARGEEGLVGA
jgi:hypothetical protein